MKTAEKIFLVIILILTFCTLFLGHPWTTFLFIFIIILSICYSIGGVYFFKRKKSDNKKLNILAGVILGTSLGTLSYSLWIPISISRKVIVSINILFALSLLGFWLYKKVAFKENLKFILYRSLAIALLTSFFTFSHVSDNTYRIVLQRMTEPESSLSKNLLMFEKVNEYENFLESKDYKNAILSAKQGIIYGKEWRDYDREYYQDFSGLYEFLAEAYIGLGDSLYDTKDYSSALRNYQLADSVLTHNEHIPQYPKATESDIYWNRYNLLLTYNKLSYLDSYDTELNYLLDNYFEVKDSVDIDYYHLLENAATNHYYRNWYESSIDINKSCLIILQQDSLNNIREFKNTYIRLLNNYLSTDSLEQTKIILSKLKNISSKDDCEYLFYQTGILFRENIKESLNSGIETCECFNKKDNVDNIFQSNLLLASIELENSNYSNFEKQIQLCRDLISKTTAKAANEVKLEELLGHYNKLKGQYNNSKKHYTKALDYYRSDESDKQLLFELNIAQINDELDIPYNKEKINTDVLKFLKEYEPTYPNITRIHNELGNININYNVPLSDSLFKYTIECHQKFDIKNSPKLGIAYNGLGLNQLNESNYKKADSLFLLAKRQLDKFYGEKQNFNQIITLLNLAESKLLQNDISNCKQYLQEAILTKKKCFNDDIIVYDVDILRLEGNLIENEINGDASPIEKYEQAMLVALNFFDENHSIINYLKQKINE
ncbi:hypothetical protein [Mangrovimonas sp. TPBH4]|uniref:hypothetical protein n=1 Tax=Mangrovimonas sp. TPBH4 TaxID=1645914 RepID=UPI0006B69F70|nr:hypothetical protein [Mangrovimonas sp. TPBH4]